MQTWQLLIFVSYFLNFSQTYASDKIGWVWEDGEPVYYNPRTPHALDGSGLSTDESASCDFFFDSDIKNRPVREFPYDFEGPYEMHPNFPQLGEHFEAVVYYLKTKGLMIPLVFPSLVQGEARFSGLFNQSQIDEILDLVKSLPYKYIHLLTELRLNPDHLPIDDSLFDAAEYDLIVAYANSATNSIDLSPFWARLLDKHPNVAVHIFSHEFGHLLAYHLFGEATPSEEYARAASLDGNQITVMESSELSEDWADAIATYLQDDGSSRLLYPNRFAFIDLFFN